MLFIHSNEIHFVFYKMTFVVNLLICLLLFICSMHELTKASKRRIIITAKISICEVRPHEIIIYSKPRLQWRTRPFPRVFTTVKMKRYELQNSHCMKFLPLDKAYAGFQ